MGSKWRFVLPAAVSLAVAAMLIASPAALPQGIQEVFVANWPTLQKVEGEVAIRGPVHLSQSVAKEGLVVAPVDRKDFTRMQPVFTLDTDGFANVVLSVAGRSKGEIFRPGKVGAILIPDVELASSAFFEKGQYLFSMEVVASDVSSEAPYFASVQPRYQIGFNRYHVLLYNTTDKSVEIDFYAYLTN